MSFDAIQTGCVIRYPYLWSWEAEQGRTEGSKIRPVVVGVRLPRPTGDGLLLLPITSKEPVASRFAAEIPDMEKRRAGLETGLRLWIMLDDYNEDIVGLSVYLEPEPPLGRFSKAFFLPLMREFVARYRGAKSIRRR